MRGYRYFVAYSFLFYYSASPAEIRISAILPGRMLEINLRRRRGGKRRGAPPSNLFVSAAQRRRSSRRHARRACRLVQAYCRHAHWK
jgi:hypothetical protein